MAAQEDQALLFLIFQHLKVNGFTKAARVLEKHLPQVEAPPAESLHDIYTGWMKLCSLSQHAKQETDDSLNKKSIKVEFIASEEAADSKLCAVSGEDEVKAKLLTECESDIESSHPEKNPESALEPQRDATTSVPLQVLNGESSASSDGKVEEEEMREELTNIHQEGSVEESAEVSNEEKVSPASVETVKSSRPESDPALDGEPTEEPEEDGSKELLTHSSSTEVPDEAPASERMDPDPTKAPDVLDEEKDEEQSAVEPSELISVDPMEEETNDQPVELQAPPPADCATEKTKDDEEEQDEEEQDEKEQGEEEQGEEEQEQEEEENGQNSEPVGGAELPSQLNPDAAAEESTSTQKQTVAADLHRPHSDVPEEPDASIILNIQTDVEAAQQEGSRSVPEESSESCADSKTPKRRKRKKNKRNTETPETEAQVTDTPSDPGDTPLTSKSSKKKRRRQKRGEDDVRGEEEAAEEQEVVPAATSEKKKAKKRKRDKDMTLETKTTEIQVKDLEAEENTPAETEKPKKKKRKKEKEAPSEEPPAEGDEETEEKIDSIDDGSSALLFSGKKKKRLCRKLSVRIRPRFHGKRMSSIQTRQKMGKKKPKDETLDEKSQMNPVKRAQADDETEIKPPKGRRRKKMKIVTEQEESSLKENKPPGKEEKSMETQWDKNGVGEELPEEDLSLLSNEGKKKKKKKKKKRVKDETVEESSGSADVSQPPLSKKKKKSSLKAGPEDGDSHTPAVSAKKKKSFS
ncbi:glutamic acid-rich protein isoform X1 [Oryzias melastigma]|uniref:Glutamic acid-rich protein-like n=1 Tax=Oryzias melastigma TaxID=30732 RepID=A0A3B3B8J5_ORYME|nr:glutamic acid-rich protein isoform X1 [Oryzias melastigma]